MRARVATDTEFQKLNKEIGVFDERKSRKQISLNLEARKKERIQDKLEEKKAEEVTSEETATEGPIFASGYYNNEVLRIGLDYVQVLHSMATAGTK